MNLKKKIESIKASLRAAAPPPVPEELRAILPLLPEAPPEVHRRMLNKEMDRMMHRSMYAGHAEPGPFTFDFTPAQIEQAVQVMLDVAYPEPELRTPLDVDPGDIEAVALRMLNEKGWDSFGPGEPGSRTPIADCARDVMDRV